MDPQAASFHKSWPIDMNNINNYISSLEDIIIALLSNHGIANKRDMAHILRK